jgi:hypothetical protein
MEQAEQMVVMELQVLQVLMVQVVLMELQVLQG